MPIELKEFLVNLKNWEFDYSPYKVDKNEADKITYALTQLELKMVSLEKFSDRNKGRWIQNGNAYTYHCSECGFYNSHSKSIKYCEQCGSRMESD